MDMITDDNDNDDDDDDDDDDNNNNNNSIENKKKKKDRRNQLYYRYLTLYGASLTKTEKSKDHFGSIVVPSLKPSANTTTISESVPRHRSDSPRVARQYTAETIKAGNTRRREDEQQKQEDEIWKSRSEEIKDSIGKKNWQQAIKIIDGALPHIKLKEYQLKFLKRKLSILDKNICSITHADQAVTTSTSTTNENYQVTYLETLTSIVHLDGSVVNPWTDAATQKCMQRLMGDADVKKELWYRWQIEHIDSRLPHKEKKITDERVKDYEPDEWQVQFLNAIDRNESCLIVAPTSSGKTYASHYVIDSVLKTSDNGICVYVGPTKALVNQVYAVLYSRFATKDYSFGIFTRDFRLNVSNCRVLCTVPQCLQILLLSPSPEHQKLCNKIKYVIFDEVHCMSHDDSWETCMRLLDSPLIGLSATVNNGRTIQEWLTYIERRRYELKEASSVRRVRLIVSHKRLTDLHKYLYSKKQLHPIHPIGLMDSERLIKSGSIPNDLLLSPKETMQLYDAIKKADNFKYIPSLEHYFHDDWIIERDKFDTYSKLVCKQFNQMIQDKNFTLINSITSHLSTDLVKNDYPQPIELHNLVIDFVLTLEKNNQLPCIVFTDSRRLCKNMTEFIGGYFKTKETEIRESTSFQEEIELIKKKKRKFDRLNNLCDDKLTKEQRETLNTEREAAQLSAIEQRKLAGILPDCTLITRSPTDIESQFLERVDDQANFEFLEHMERGVAYHHAGVNKSQRTAIEALFRSGYLKVIFSTATLASGIHMPCKTVAFVKDSIWLDALYYRQASGRAGRRGFDLQGNVVFLNIPLLKIGHLTIAPVPDIYSHFPSTVTFLLRLLHLFTKSSTKENDQTVYIRSLIALECPLSLSLNNQHMATLIQIQTKFHCLYTLDFLYRLNLIDASGKLIGLGSLMTHLLPYEPANLLLSYLIEKNLFSNEDLQEDHDKQIVMVLSYLFTHLPVYADEAIYQDLMGKRRDEKYNSMLLLPGKDRISPAFRQGLNAYNNLVLFVYEQYFINVINQLRKQFPHVEQCLPLSNINFKTSDIYDPGTFEYQLHYHYTWQEKTFLTPFSGVSGISNDDYLNKYNSLSYDLAYDLDISSQIIPYFEIDNIYRCNSYAYDFYNHGSKTDIINENLIPLGDIYTVLNDFRLVLKRFEKALRIIDKKIDQSNDLETYKFFKLLHTEIKQVTKKYVKNFEKTNF
ncbi:unnamed protein product [Adineta steineri]|uniref:Uncharacterized protein n=1 Tax=Adineta steineri TaxID=433720 RepID=A0A813XYX2_9BILA|nr:unnamed protein product [Adineta steineri]CAF3949009.1 unnamed protein product [Adineta steineri]